MPKPDLNQFGPNNNYQKALSLFKIYYAKNQKKVMTQFLEKGITDGQRETDLDSWDPLVEPWFQ